MLDGFFQPMHLLIILVVALLVFDPKRLPELGKGLGEAISGFKEPKGGSPTHPIPATGAIETSRGVKGEAPSDKPHHS